MELRTIIEHAVDGEAVLFVGSGFSRSAKNVAGTNLKTASGLAAHLSRLCGLETPGSLSDVADLYLEKYGATRLVELLVAEFQVATLAPEHLPFGRIPWRRIYTTNYDNAIELAHKDAIRTVVAITLADSVKRVSESSAQCVHINGFIDHLTEQELNASFKLTDTSYSSSEFAASAWAGQFRHDISAATAVIFVGYSASDLDVKRILLASPEAMAKAVFAVGKTPDEITRHKLSKFGTVLAEDTFSIATEIESVLASYTPREHKSVRGRYVVAIGAPSEVANPRDRDVQDLFLWGRVDRQLVWTSVSGSGTGQYMVTRDSVATCLQLLEDGEPNIVVRSDLGNGKTLFLESLGAMAAQFGYQVLYFDAQGVGSVAEIEAASRCHERTLLLIDSYTTKRAEIEVLARNRSDQLQVVYSARTLRHDVSYGWLSDQLGVDTIPEIDLDRLTESDRNSLTAMLDSYGLWGTQAEQSDTRKKTFLRDKCESRMSAVLLEVLRSPVIVRRLKEVVGSIEAEARDFLEATASVLALSVIEIGTTLEILSDLIGTETLNKAQFRKHESVQELLDFQTGRITVKSAVIARHLLTTAMDPGITVAALSRMARNADALSASDLYWSILRDLMRFSNIQNVLPTEHKLNAVLVYYEGMKNLQSCRKNPNFWLQYAIATLALERFDDARIKLDTAYAHAKARPGYNTFMIDNTAARLELEQLISDPTADREKAIASFRKARTILNEQVSIAENRHYPYRVAAKYAQFLSTHRKVLELSDIEEIARAARFILRRVDCLAAYRANHRYVQECREAMVRILFENPISDA